MPGRINQARPRDAAGQNEATPESGDPGVARLTTERRRRYGMLGFPFFSVAPMGQHSADP